MIFNRIVKLKKSSLRSSLALVLLSFWKNKDLIFLMVPDFLAFPWRPHVACDYPFLNVWTACSLLKKRKLFFLLTNSLILSLLHLQQLKVFRIFPAAPFCESFFFWIHAAPLLPPGWMRVWFCVRSEVGVTAILWPHKHSCLTNEAPPSKKVGMAARLIEAEPNQLRANKQMIKTTLQQQITNQHSYGCIQTYK